MRIEAAASEGPTLDLVIYAENETERAVISQFVHWARKPSSRIVLRGSTYECDVHATTKFIIGVGDL
jgi:hypothetical protein